MPAKDSLSSKQNLSISSRVVPALNDTGRIREVNRKLKNKWIEIITMKTALFDVEAKMIEMNRRSLRTEFGPKLSPVFNDPKERGSDKLHVNVIPDTTIGSEGHKFTHYHKHHSTRLPKEAKKILKEWLLNNISNPYPRYSLLTSFQTKLYLSKTTGLSLSQIKNWFINTRKRALKPFKKDDSGIVEEDHAGSNSHEQYNRQSKASLAYQEDTEAREIAQINSGTPSNQSAVGIQGETLNGPNQHCFPVPGFAFSGGHLFDPRSLRQEGQLLLPGKQVPVENLQSYMSRNFPANSLETKSFSDPRITEYFDAYIKGFPYFMLMHQYAMSSALPGDQPADANKGSNRMQLEEIKPDISLQRYSSQHNDIWEKK